MHPTLSAAVYAAPLLLATLAVPAHAQGAKVSSTGQYQASLACGGGVADVPGPNKESYTSVGIMVWDSSVQLISRPVVTCGASVAIGGPGAATIQWWIYVVDKTYKLVKQCQAEPNTPIGGGRYPCKGSGNVSATLTIRPQ